MGLTNWKEAPNGKILKSDFDRLLLGAENISEKN